jgi:hypothetical protein
MAASLTRDVGGDPTPRQHPQPRERRHQSRIDRLHLIEIPAAERFGGPRPYTPPDIRHARALGGVWFAARAEIAQWCRGTPPI